MNRRGFIGGMAAAFGLVVIPVKWVAEKVARPFKSSSGTYIGNGGTQSISVGWRPDIVLIVPAQHCRKVDIDEVDIWG